VPIVWVMAFVMGPRSAIAGAPAHDGVALHGESTNNARSEHTAKSEGHENGHDSAGKSDGKPKPTRAAGNKLPTDKKHSRSSGHDSHATAKAATSHGE
jgi:hypothetical protein